MCGYPLVHFGVMVGVVLILLWPVLFYRLQRDQMVFAYLAQQWMHGHVPYAEIATQQWPGQIFLYLMTFKILGVSATAIRSVDLFCQLVACGSLFVIISKLGRPLFGVLAAALFAFYYTRLGAWNTANRETYQIAFILPVLAWLLFYHFPVVLDGLVALLSGALIALAVWIKPTIGLVLLPLIYLIFFPPVPYPRPGRKWLRFGLFSAGGAGLSLALFLLFASHLSAAYDFLISYNVRIYSQIRMEKTAFAAVMEMLVTQFKEFGYIVPVVFILIAAPGRKVLPAILAVHVGCMISVSVQQRYFPYHLWVIMPLTIFWLVAFKQILCEFIINSIGKPARLKMILPLASLVTALLAVLCIPPHRVLDPRAWMDYQHNPVTVRGGLPQIWEDANQWLATHTAKGSTIFIYGSDYGVQFLHDIPPLTRMTSGVLDYRDAALNEHPLTKLQKATMMEDLQIDPPDWILVATYDETWIARSGVQSLEAFPEFKQFIADYYEAPGHTGLQSYLAYQRKP